jgi:hypothetical protein
MKEEERQKSTSAVYITMVIMMAPAVPIFFLPTLGDPSKGITVLCIAATTIGLVSTLPLWESPKIGFISKFATIYYALPILMTIAIIIKNFDVITHYYRRLLN